MLYVYLVIGLLTLLVSANYLVDSSVALAKKAKISNFVIGLTIVGMGTSAPELFVSITSAINGMGDLALGNVIGSNICNVLLILGLTASICPFAIEKTTYHRDIPFAIIATLIVIIFANDSLIYGEPNDISAIEAFILLAAFAIYITYVVIQDRKNGNNGNSEECTSSLSGKNPFLLILIVIVTLCGLIFGGQMFLNSAQSLAKAWGMSDAVIAITVVAIGTSLPELITSIVAATKKNPQLALGNVIGSCIFNLLLIAGVSGAISPFEIHNINFVDYGVILLSVIMTFIVVFTFKKDFFDRIEGIILFAVYVIYTIYLLLGI